MPLQLTSEGRRSKQFAELKSRRSCGCFSGPGAACQSESERQSQRISSVAPTNVCVYAYRVRGCNPRPRCRRGCFSLFTVREEERGRAGELRERRSRRRKKRRGAAQEGPGWDEDATPASGNERKKRARERKGDAAPLLPSALFSSARFSPFVPKHGN